MYKYVYYIQIQLSSFTYLHGNGQTIISYSLHQKKSPFQIKKYIINSTQYGIDDQIKVIEKQINLSHLKIKHNETMLSCLRLI